MKPLEPGCLALHVGGKNLGKVSTCLHHLPAGSKWPTLPDDCVTKVSGWAVALEGKKVITATSYLIRIDGGENESVTTEQVQELPA